MVKLLLSLLLSMSTLAGTMIFCFLGLGNSNVTRLAFKSSLELWMPKFSTRVVILGLRVNFFFFIQKSISPLSYLILLREAPSYVVVRRVELRKLNYFCLFWIAILPPPLKTSVLSHFRALRGWGEKAVGDGKGWLSLPTTSSDSVSIIPLIKSCF